MTTSPAASLSRWARLVLPALAIWLLVQGVAKFPAELRAERARVAVRDDRLEDGVREAVEGLSWDRTNPYLHFYLGQAKFSLGENASDAKSRAAHFASAAESLAAAVRMYPNERWFLLNLGWALDGLERFDEAEVAFKAAVEWEPNSHQIRAYYAEHLFQAHRWAEAKEQYEKSTALYGNWPAYHGLERLKKEMEKDSGTRKP